MMTTEQTDALEVRTRTRRNVLAIGSILGGTLLSGCKSENIIFQPPENSKPHRHPGHLAGSQDPNCFLRGTRILTPNGEKQIEDLVIGDSVCTIGNGAKPIRWIGRRRYSRRSETGWWTDVKPVKIEKGVLSFGVPSADLFVSQGHRLYFDGALIAATDLINGTSINLDECLDKTELDYLHVLTEGHSIVVSEGAASETLLFDPINLKSFDNFGEYEDRYGSPSGEVEQPCAPVYGSVGNRARLLSHLRSALSLWVDWRNPIDRVRDRLETGTLITL